MTEGVVAAAGRLYSGDTAPATVNIRRIIMEKITSKVHKKLCKTLEIGLKNTKKELLCCLETIYQEWEYISKNL